MTDELDLLKQDWKKSEQNLPKISKEDIYKMIWKKSSSNIKWIFIISVLEFTLGLLLGIFYHPSEEVLQLPMLVDVITWITLVILIYFAIRFYKNYKKVTVSASVKDLMDTILKARKTVKHYIIIMLGLGGITAMFETSYILIAQNGGWDHFIETASVSKYLIIIGLSLLVTVLILGFFLGIYSLLYGILLRRLNRNYKEIKKIEV